MKIRILFCICLLLALFSACTPTMYGVPQPTWDAMSEQERLQAMRIYEDRQIARQRASAERARQNAIERERQAALKAEEERQRRERIAAIHRGEGAYGELLLVRLQGGEMRVGNRHHHYQPVSFRIAEGESLEITIVDEKRRGTALSVAYAGGALTIDSPGGAKTGGELQLPYDRRWGDGALYPDSGTAGPHQLRGVDIFVEIVGRHARSERRPPPQVIIKKGEEPRHREPAIAVVKEEKQRPPQPPAVIVREEKERPPKPPVVVVQEEKQRHRPDDRQRNGAGEKVPQATPAVMKAPGRVDIQFLGGEVKEKGKRNAIELFSIRLADGETREVALKGAAGSPPVTISYRQGVVVIDAVQANGRGKGNALRVPFDKEWQQGRVYRIEMKGRLQLEKAEVRIVAADGK